MNAGFDDNDDAPPPPYFDDPVKPSYQAQTQHNGMMGNFGGNQFWTGLAAGAGATMLGNSLMNRRNGDDRRPRAQANLNWDRGEGSSSGSSMRTSTGFGGTSNR